MPSAQTQTSAAPQNPSQPGTPEWLYDEIMRHIEPDLLTSELPKHIEKYGSETKEERLERMKAYDEAFAIFDTVEANVAQDYHQELKKVRDESQTKVVTEEKGELKKIEEQMGEA